MINQIFKSSIISLMLSIFPLTLNAKTIHSDEYRFDIVLSDSSQICFQKDKSKPYLKAYDSGCFVSVAVSSIDGEKQYSYRKTILGSTIFNKKNYIYLEPEEPWYNLLRNSRVLIEDLGDGLVLCHKLVFRAQTLFWIRVSCEESHINKAKDIIESFDENCNTYSYYRILRGNLNWLIGSAYLTLIPLLGFLCAIMRKKWKRSGKKDNMAKTLSILSAVSTLMIICFLFICLKHCIELALIIEIISIVIWIVFFSGQRFLMNFINGLFS